MKLMKNNNSLKNKQSFHQIIPTSREAKFIKMKSRKLISMLETKNKKCFKTFILYHQNTKKCSKKWTMMRIMSK
jgi:hypothetical protein